MTLTIVDGPDGCALVELSPAEASLWTQSMDRKRVSHPLPAGDQNNRLCHDLRHERAMMIMIIDSVLVDSSPLLYSLNLRRHDRIVLPADNLMRIAFYQECFIMLD